MLNFVIPISQPLQREAFLDSVDTRQGLSNLIWQQKLNKSQNYACLIKFTYHYNY